MALEDLVDIVGVTIMFLSAVIIFIVITKTQISESLGGKKVWFLLMMACILFGIRALGHFIEPVWFQIIRRSFGIIGAVIYPTALYLMYKTLRSSIISK